MNEIKFSDRLYLATDGDDVGHRLEYLMMANKVEELMGFSSQFRSAMVWFRKILEDDLKGIIIFTGGDNLLACLPGDTSLELIEELRVAFYERADRTLSIGLGSSSQRAYFALKFAKADGKDCLRHFEDLLGE